MCLEDGELKPLIWHSSDKNGILFLLFDSTHNLKNICNNWLIRTYFYISSNHSPLLPRGGIKANFKHMQQLYAKEETKVLKSLIVYIEQALIQTVYSELLHN